MWKRCLLRLKQKRCLQRQKINNNSNSLTNSEMALSNVWRWRSDSFCRVLDEKKKSTLFLPSNCSDKNQSGLLMHTTTEKVPYRKCVISCENVWRQSIGAWNYVGYNFRPTHKAPISYPSHLKVDQSMPPHPTLIVHPVEIDTIFLGWDLKKQTTTNKQTNREGVCSCLKSC